MRLETGHEAEGPWQCHRVIIPLDETAGSMVSGHNWLVANDEAAEARSLSPSSYTPEAPVAHTCIVRVRAVAATSLQGSNQLSCTHQARLQPLMRSTASAVHRPRQ